MTCLNCSRASVPANHADDVAQCVRCGQWHYHDGVDVVPVHAHDAAELAAAPLPWDEVLAALDRAAESMEIY